MQKHKTVLDATSLLITNALSRKIVTSNDSEKNIHSDRQRQIILQQRLKKPYLFLSAVTHHPHLMKMMIEKVKT